MTNLHNIGKVASIFADIEDELERADAKYNHDPMSPEEIRSSFLTIKAELVELEREVERVKRRPHLLEKEATQVAAMAVKFLRDVCHADKPVTQATTLCSTCCQANVLCSIYPQETLTCVEYRRKVTYDTN